ncbi:beta-glucuronosyltransferase GlcAT14C-like isoform X3 [Solanum dulcamara]|uniref:beta-glucuronosyltransferase GlcAT14C-like isoform X3 n=1 Tax=Solanum dulcamara TaxID=45834 RepID=UPI0024865685|nr:beta-glucuronosyltransferase GlcAT14C-like isoform X3 [Solanum dulcamara]
MMLKMLRSWNWKSCQGIRLSVLVAVALLLLVVGFFCSRFDDDQFRTTMNNIPDDHANVINDTSTTKRITKMIHPSKGRPGDPPILAYWIFGFRGESKRMLRLLKAVYHPRNQYLLHLLDGDGDEERMELAVSVESEQVFRAFGNVNVVGKSYAVEESGASALAAMLHASALLLRISSLWDWFITLSSSDYPLFTQDDILFALTSLPRDLNFLGFTNRTIDQKGQHNFNRIVVDPSLHSKRATPLYYAVETREVPLTFDIFEGSPWMVLSRGFMEHCIKGWDNFPRKLLMYYANVVSPLESYFHTVLCNSPEFRNTIVNQDLRCSVPINVSNYHDDLVNKWAIFARPFKEGDPTLDELDRDILDRQPQGLVRGKWCNNGGHNSSSCSSNSSTNWDDTDSLDPGFNSEKLQNILSNFTVGDHHKVTNHCHGSSS